ncbi:unnamed protein product [Triticum turgidum subsp. durum]|uniref:F-box domain-containing protein n=1 Tax=Triticum turgidum subsp. durum TaxID=4567 RepID=A0A9R1RWZ3_TRITD|nr:unnamed protein product [Triticum turgidum subsp. durum]
MTRRRSPRLHPQIHTTTEEAAGMALRRSPRLHPQIPVSGEDAGVTRRRSSRLNPQIRVGEDGTGATGRRSTREEGAGEIRHSRRRRRRRRGNSPGKPASLSDNDDMLREILLRLPSQPYSLPRASAVCKRWRRVTTDPRFLRSFSAHHRKPPILGVFERDDYDIVFTPVLDHPDRIPPERFDVRHHVRGFRKFNLLGCRHGRVLLRSRRTVIVLDPITSEHRRIEAPPVFTGLVYLYGTVLCAAADPRHTHGSCHSSPFTLVLMSPCQGYKDGTPPIACVYSSATGLWENHISTTDRCVFVYCNPGILVGNAIYWSSQSVDAESNFLNLDELADDIIEFDLDRQSLAVIKGPPDLNHSTTHQIIQTEDGDVGIAIFSHGRFEMWQRKVSCFGGATWFLHKTVEIHTVLGIPPQVEGSVRGVKILGYDEDNGVMFLFLDYNVYMVQVMSMQPMKHYQSNYASYADDIHPFTSFYAPAIPGGRDGAEMLQDM